MKASAVVFVLAGVVLGCQGEGVPPADLKTDLASLRAVPTSVTIDSRTLSLTSELWRNVMPSPEPATKRPLQIVARVAAQTPPVPDSLQLGRVWVIKDQEVWESRLERQSDAADAVMSGHAAGGPEYDQGTLVTVVVELRRGDRSWLVRADQQRVDLAH